jgi:hypothetical protein
VFVFVSVTSWHQRRQEQCKVVKEESGRKWHDISVVHVFDSRLIMFHSYTTLGGTWMENCRQNRNCVGNSSSPVGLHSGKDTAIAKTNARRAAVPGNPDRTILKTHVYTLHKSNVKHEPKTRVYNLPHRDGP